MLEAMPKIWLQSRSMTQWARASNHQKPLDIPLSMEYIYASTENGKCILSRRHLQRSDECGRKKQVTLMADVYKEARTVLVWLEEPMNSQIAFVTLIRPECNGDSLSEKESKAMEVTF